MNLDQAKGMFVGLAVGDALGTTVEGSRPTAADPLPFHTEMLGGGPTGVPPGGWTDDTSMAVAMADSLIKCNGFDAADIMDKFYGWWETGAYSPSNKCVDIGNATRAALEFFEQHGEYDRPYSASVQYNTSGNGGIMRMAPVIIWNHKNHRNAMIDAVRQSMLTHASEECIECAIAFADDLWHGKRPPLCFRPDKMDDRGFPYSGGHVMETYPAALYAVACTNSFEEAVITAVNFGYDADTVGAVTGQLAGRIYGYSSIPTRWLDKLLWKDYLVKLAINLYGR